MLYKNINMKLAAIYHKLLVMSTQCCKKVIYNKEIKQLKCFICAGDNTLSFIVFP